MVGRKDVWSGREVTVELEELVHLVHDQAVSINVEHFLVLQQVPDVELCVRRPNPGWFGLSFLDGLLLLEIGNRRDHLDYQVGKFVQLNYCGTVQRLRVTAAENNQLTIRVLPERIDQDLDARQVRIVSQHGHKHTLFDHINFFRLSFC